MKQVASLRYEVIFKKAFTQLDIFTAFVKDFTGVTLEIDKVETEKTFATPIGKINSRFDLFAEDEKNRTIVDIQHVRFPDHYHRFLHYHCTAVIEQAGSAETYNPDLKVFTIVLLTSGDKHKTDYAEIDFDPKQRDGKSLGEIQHKIVYLCPKYADHNTPAAQREWLEAIQDSLDGEIDETLYQRSEIQKIFTLIEKDQLSPEEYARMKDEYGYQQIGRTQFEKGRKEGRREGREEGRERGREEGKEEVTEQIRHKMRGILQNRFGELPNNIQALLTAFTQLEDFMDLYATASHCESLEAFAAYCQARKTRLS